MNNHHPTRLTAKFIKQRNKQIEFDSMVLLKGNKLKQTSRGLEFCEGAVALQQNIIKYPSYKDLQREHTKQFNVLELLKTV